VVWRHVLSRGTVERNGTIIYASYNLNRSLYCSLKSRSSRAYTWYFVKTLGYNQSVNQSINQSINKAPLHVTSSSAVQNVTQCLHVIEQHSFQPFQAAASGCEYIFWQMFVCLIVLLTQQIHGVAASVIPSPRTCLHLYTVWQTVAPFLFLQ